MNISKALPFKLIAKNKAGKEFDLQHLINLNCKKEAVMKKRLFMGLLIVMVLPACKKEQACDDISTLKFSATQTSTSLSFGFTGNFESNQPPKIYLKPTDSTTLFQGDSITQAEVQQISFVSNTTFTFDKSHFVNTASSNLALDTIHMGPTAHIQYMIISGPFMNQIGCNNSQTYNINDTIYLP